METASAPTPASTLPDNQSENLALAEAAALDIRNGFADYNARFRAITRRAQARFESRDFSASQADALERFDSYDICVRATMARLETLLRARVRDHALWQQIRPRFAELIAPLLDQELNKTFYNTLTRRFFHTQGVDATIEFVALDIEPTDRITHAVARHSYAVWGHLPRICQRILDDYKFAVPYAHTGLCALRMVDALTQQLSRWGADANGASPIRAIELLETVFYRERRAYLIGRIFGVGEVAPLVIALINEDAGLRVDAVLTERAQVAQVFGYTRSYFQADLPTVGDAVVFLRTLLPYKPIDELYTVLGRAKQGKTERYRHFFRHLAARRDEQFVHADGERGLVMAVFTLPSYPLVFKLIRDKFAFPKESVRAEVMQKYTLVFRRDRAGRLVDAQRFRFLRFPKRQFASELLDELLVGCSESAHLDGDDIVITHCYVERRLRPLNLYLREAEPAAAQRAIVDYGQAIRDLAASNIFPGDLLLKNFGVSAHGRVIFYDYDELCLVSDCRFRELPEDDERGETFYVGAHDVFPEQFPRFLGMGAAQRAALLAAHGDVFTVRWWQSMQAAVAAQRTLDTPPYPEEMRLKAQGFGVIKGL
ncbi:MAG: bifunctional isocitrate dehydrogenase kinase/phosphatase [Gammaproteobacteria bacterium]|nr:MAG: bifunctional isocitrate dehydrogenase kinase/phosphatase [Gammaproteobacteria bacterium]